MPQGNAVQAQPESVPPKRAPAHYLWAVLIARIYEVFPLLCPMCGGQMRLIAFITEGAQIRRVLEHIGVESEPPRPLHIGKVLLTLCWAPAIPTISAREIVWPRRRRQRRCRGAVCGWPCGACQQTHGYKQPWQSTCSQRITKYHRLVGSIQLISFMPFFAQEIFIPAFPRRREGVGQYYFRPLAQVIRAQGAIEIVALTLL